MNSIGTLPYGFNGEILEFAFFLKHTQNLRRSVYPHVNDWRWLTATVQASTTLLLELDTLNKVHFQQHC